jgi:hypothetical protein
MNSIAPTVHPSLVRYANGEISKATAIDQLGPDATIHDLVHQMLQAGLEAPRMPREFEEAQLAKARRMLGLVK